MNRTIDLAQVSLTARQAIRANDWATVDACAREILRRAPGDAEGHFLAGLVHKASRKPLLALQSFEKALALDAGRYDAAVELANQLSVARRNAEAAALLEKYEHLLDNSPRYLDMAGTVYSEIGMPEKAWPLYEKATSLQPEISLFQANLASCAVYLGKIEAAAGIYRKLLNDAPGHRRNHYLLSRLARAKDATHVEQMKEMLRRNKDTPDKNIFMYYAIAKELEDLGQWDESFEYYRKAGDAVCSVAVYDVEDDVRLIDKIIESCDGAWLANDAGGPAPESTDRTPVFIVGLPRTGTTLVERIVSSHSQVESLGETQFVQMVLRRESGIHSVENMNPEMIDALLGKDMGPVASAYLDAVRYRLGDAPFFIDKLPFNFLFLGFIAKAFPEARIIHLSRHPMDACFSMYKQVFTWAYKFSYSLEQLGRYYVAYDRLHNHWREVLRDRLIEIDYESLVADQEGQTRALLDRLGLPFEQACLDFDRNAAPSTTASSVQVREKAHTRSVGKWRRFEAHLQPLRDHLEGAGIVIE
jgi:thioredoxin-like negative regulator of GroEL